MLCFWKAGITCKQLGFLPQFDFIWISLTVSFTVPETKKILLAEYFF